MKALKSNVIRALQVGSIIPTCDNSGAKMIRITAVIGYKGSKGKHPSTGVGDLVMASVRKGIPQMQKQVVHAIIVRQKKEFLRKNGIRIKFEDNAAVVLKDDIGNPKGTLIKGPISKEAAIRWPGVAKLASIII